MRPPAHAAAQVGSLLHLRWVMLRSSGARLLAGLGVGLLLLLLWLAVTQARGIEPAALSTVVRLAPSALLGFGALALIAPISAGGGNEVIPTDQLVAFPVRSSTYFLAGLVLAPLNLVWVVQLLVLAGVTSVLTRGGSLLLGGLTAAAYVLAITAVGQAIAWAVAGLRQSRPGRRWVLLSSGAGLLAVGLALRLVGGDGLLERSPTRSVAAAVVAAGRPGGFARWAMTTGVLALVAVLGLMGGAWLCAWALRRPRDLGVAAPTRVRRRRAARSALWQLVAVDRASVWRAPALRRGGLVLVVLPGLIAAGAGVPWASLVVLPGLVAAGAALLFGINVFSLDGAGALWLASLPHDPRLTARAKTLVLSETVLVGVAAAALAGSLRSPGPPTRTELVAIVASGLTSTALVVALALSSSVRRPHRADLNGSRDAVAPPGALVLASIRLALPTALIGLVLGATARLGVSWLPVALAGPVLVWCWWSLRRSIRRYAQPRLRARIVSRVAAG